MLGEQTSGALPLRGDGSESERSSHPARRSLALAAWTAPPGRGELLPSATVFPEE